MNYTLNEYASDVVYRIKSVCDARDVPHPMIVSESGRAIAAHHSLLVFDVLGSSKLDQFKVTGRPEEDYHGKEEVPQPVRDLFDSYRSVNERRLVECYHDGLQAREQALQMFNLGYLSLEFRALAEKLYWATCTKIRDYCRKLDRVPEELENLEDMLSDIYFCNFSVFQSLPDSWAIGQLFPIMPIQRLGERPRATPCWPTSPATRTAKSTASCIPARPSARWRCTNWSPAEPYYLAAFLVGAYQETSGGPAQPVRRHPCGAHPAAGGGRLGDRGNRQGRHRQQGARVHGIRHRRALSGHRPGLRTGHPGGPDDARRSAGGEAFLRKRAQRLRLPRGRITRQKPCLPTIIPWRSIKS
jgi:arginine decarboxylase-like protein